jgi:hypothetical protein
MKVIYSDKEIIELIEKDIAEKMGSPMMDNVEFISVNLYKALNDFIEASASITFKES